MSSVRSSLLKFTERACWAAFLLWIGLASLVSTQYQSVSWMLMSFLLYSIALVYIIVIILGCTYNGRALRRSWLVIVIAALPLIWLYLQTQLPLGNALFRSLNSYLAADLWLLPPAQISIDPARTLALLISCLPAFTCMLLVCSMVTSRARVKQLLYFFTLLFLLHSMVAIYAKYSGFYLIDKNQLDGHWSAARGWFVNRNHFAAFIINSLLGVLTFINYRAYYNRSLLSKLALTILVILSLVTIALSQSRAGLVCWVLIMLLVWFASLRELRRVGIDRRTGQHTPAYVFVGLLTVTAIAIIFGSELLTRLQQSSLGIGERGLQWQITWSAIKLSPWFGYGGGSYAQVFQYFREHAELRQVVFDQSHNHYLHVLLEQGLIGLLLWLALLVVVGATAFSTIRHSQSRLVVCATVAASLLLLSALAQSLVDFNLQIINLRCFFFVIIGLILALPSARYKQGTHR